MNRVFESLDINPSLINTLNNVTSDVTGLLDEVVGEVDGLLGSITQGGNNVRFVVCTYWFPRKTFMELSADQSYPFV